MTGTDDRSTSHRLTAALASAFLLAAPAQAQVISHSSLATDHAQIQEGISKIATVILGEPLNACGRIEEPGTYVLTRNLFAPGDCFVVAADFVTLDLSGFALFGDGAGAGVTTDTAFSTPRRGITVRHGSVTGFNHGIDLVDAHSSMVMTVRAIGNRGDGIRAGLGNTISGNTAQANGGSGIVTGDGGTVTGNTALGNGGDGIFVSPESTVSGNASIGNVFEGIDAGEGSTVTYNTASDNDRNGILAGEASSVISNTANGNGSSGILAADGSTLANNTASGNGIGGLGGDLGSTLSGNTTWLNGFDGIFATNGTTLSGNTAQGNGDNGLDVLCPSNLLDNTATGNANDNLELQEFPIDPCNEVNNLAP